MVSLELYVYTNFNCCLERKTNGGSLLKFRYCEKATKFKEISNSILKLLMSNQSGIFFRNCLAFLEYLNFTVSTTVEAKFKA